jgi:Ca2+-binding RTX toxin-like protein
MATINGTQFDDSLHGTEESDFIRGHEGDDELRGGGGDDTLVGGEGNDTLVGDAGHDLLVGGEGRDVLAYAFGGNDTLVGGAGDDRFEFFASGPHHITVLGGEGIDEMTYAGDSAVVDLQAGTFASTSGTTMAIQGIENFQSFSDGTMQIYGNAADNFIFSGNGDDIISGREGNDTLFGGPGDDVYLLDAAPGEANADRLFLEKYDVALAGFDENDRLALDNDVMGELGAEGDFAADDERFFAAAGATAGAEQDDRVVYDTETGRLYYDADGSGGGEAKLIALLVTPGYDLAASDITVL